MTSKPMTKMDWMVRETRLERACQAAEEIVIGKPLPINPLEVADLEGRYLLRCHGEDFGDAFDGQLKYHTSHRCIVLLYNTKYNRGILDGNHPRTRFSIAHELGHYFLEKHLAYLMNGGQAHLSQSELRTDTIVEQEADAFASGLLMPGTLARRLVNQGDLTLDVVHDLAGRFNLSVVSTSLCAVQLSDFPCAVVGLREGQVRWCFRSKPLADTGFYPPEKHPPKSRSALAQWKAFESGQPLYLIKGSVFTKEWFRIYDRGYLANLHVDEYFLPVPTMGTLVVLLVVPEDQLLDED